MPDSQPGSRGTLLATGGAGFIGSHVAVLAMQAGWRVVILDDLSNSSRDSVDRLASLGGGRVDLVQGDLCDPAVLDRAFALGPIDAVLHFAALRFPVESVHRPAAYYRVNVGGSAALCEVMERHGTRRLVFSSSCSVYGQPPVVPVPETCARVPLTPYGATKAVGEDLFEAAANALDWSVFNLRYFNPVGAHPSHELGEAPRTITNLVPVVMEVAMGERASLVVYGREHGTPDGTCIRDYIHVMDLAQAHVVALDATASGRRCRSYNVGTGRGHSVLEVVEAARRATGHPIPLSYGPARPEDVPEVVADSALIQQELGWRATRSLDDMLVDSIGWRRRWAQL